MKNNDNNNSSEYTITYLLQLAADIDNATDPDVIRNLEALYTEMALATPDSDVLGVVGKYSLWELYLQRIQEGKAIEISDLDVVKFIHDVWELFSPKSVNVDTQSLLFDACVEIKETADSDTDIHKLWVVQALTHFEDTLRDPNIMCIRWSSIDVAEVDPTLSESEMQDVLNHMECTHDANYGITWDTISSTIELIKLKRK